MKKLLLGFALILSACVAPTATGGGPNRPEPTEARAGLETACTAAQVECKDIVYLGGVPETEDSYELAVYVMTIDGEQTLHIAMLEAGKVVKVK